MAKVETFICDICNKDRREDSNHWRSVQIFSDDNTTGNYFTVCPFRELYLSEDNATQNAEVCGNECATKLFQRWLTTGKLTQ